MARVMAKKPRWVFDRLPPSGARRGGDPSEHAFDATLATFVREVIQNANDQAIDQRARRSAVYFDHYQLSGKQLQDFLGAVDAEKLFKHVAETAGSSGMSKLGSGLKAASKRLSLLRVADYHTHGLTGDEDAEESHFRSLCKDTLLSYKQGEGAGGSYGLGKSVLWSFSSLSTVLFSSSFDDGPQKRFRLIGRAELPSHKVSDHGFSGSGWFGLVASTKTGDRAESVWDKQARELASRIHLDRREGSGTSILVVGFRDPTTDEELTHEQLLADIRGATGRDFWPALTWPGAPLEVFVDGQRVDVELEPELRPLVQSWRASGGTNSAETVGEIIQHEVLVDLPRRRDAKRKGPQVRACLSLYLGDSDDVGESTRGGRQTSVFRGPGMVVERWDHNDLRRSPRPFRAVLACGLARSPEKPSDDDYAFEHFLRCCEPPGHDTWRATPRVKTEYIRGYGNALKRLRSEVDAFIRKHVLQSQASASEAPAHIRDLFPLFASGSSGSGTASAFVIHDLKATLEGDAWVFEGAIRSASPGRAWRGEVRLFPIDEDGRPIGEAIPIVSLLLGRDGRSAAIEAGVAKIHADESQRELRFIGQSVALAGDSEAHVAVCLEVNAQVVKL